MSQKKKAHQTLLEVKQDAIGMPYISKHSTGVAKVKVQQSTGKNGALRIDIRGTGVGGRDIDPGYRRIGAKPQQYKKNLPPREGPRLPRRQGPRQAPREGPRLPRREGPRLPRTEGPRNRRKRD